MISVPFEGKPFSITVRSKAEEAEIEWFSEDLQDFLELMTKKDAIFIIGDLNAGSQ